MAEPLRKFDVTYVGGATTTVLARDEAHARHLAMVEKYGPPPGRLPAVPCSNPYQGRGLSVFEVG